MSLFASTSVSIKPSDQTVEAVIRKFEGIAASLGYKRGHFHGEGRPIVLEEEGRLKAYFVGNISRTTLKIEVLRKDGSILARFEEFGVKEFSKAGAEEYRRFIGLLVQAFGKGAVREHVAMMELHRPNSRLLSDAYASALLRRASFSAPKPGR